MFLPLSGALHPPTHDQAPLERVVFYAAAQGDGMPSYLLAIGGSQIEVHVQLAQSSLSTGDVLSWVRRSAVAVANYYGQFPVHRARVIVTQSSDEGRSIHGTTWGNVDGVSGLTRIRIGRSVSKADLDTDWTMTHELVHMALTSLPDTNHWLEEGLATYVEPIARAQAGRLSENEVWEEMLDGMQHGEPASGDHGLDQTHTWGRTYWGGALFSLIADVEIRKATGNQKGLQDALRAIVAKGATIDSEYPLRDVLKIGDQATGTMVLQDLYARWKDTPITVDLGGLWSELGVQYGPRGITFHDDAPLAKIRQSITRPHR